MSAPAVGDINGDGLPEVVVCVHDGKVYAFGATDCPPGLAVTAYDNGGQTGPMYFASPCWPLRQRSVSESRQSFLRHDRARQPRAYLTHWAPPILGARACSCPTPGPSTTPAVGDIDGDGYLESRAWVKA